MSAFPSAAEKQKSELSDMPQFPFHTNRRGTMRIMLLVSHCCGSRASSRQCLMLRLTQSKKEVAKSRLKGPGAIPQHACIGTRGLSIYTVFGVSPHFSCTQLGPC